MAMRDTVADSDLSAPPRTTRPLRILQVAPDFSVGGAERMLASLSRHLVEAGHVVTAVSLFPRIGSSVEDELRAAGVPQLFLGKRQGFDPRMVLRFAAAVAEFRPDVIHTHAYVLRYTFPAALPLRQRMVHTLHNVADKEVDAPGRALQQVAFRTGVVPVAIGDEVAATFKRVYRMAVPYTVANGIPVEDYGALPGTRETLRASLGIPDDAPAFITVGRLAPQKNHVGLIAAFDSPRLRSLGAHLLIAGEGALRDALTAQVQRAGLTGRVHLLGLRTDVAAILAAADVFVLSSSWEGNPLTVMEAMAAGKPVVSTSVGCVPQLVSDATGVLVAPDDPAALERGMARLAEDLPAARRMGSAGRRVAMERFSDREMAAAYERIYATIVG